MRKYILPVIIFLCVLALTVPAMSFAAYNDVVFTEGITVTINGHDYMIDPRSVLEEFTVGATTLTVEMEVDSRLIMSSTERMEMVNDSGTDTDCSEADISTLDITGTANLTVVITPSGTCSAVSGGGARRPSAPPEEEPEEEAPPEKPIEEMTAGELRARIAEIQEQIIGLLQQLIDLIQEQIDQLS